MSLANRSRARSLCFEMLDSRRVCAGDVTVRIGAENKLIITGDDAANAIQVVYTSDGVTVTGLKYSGQRTDKNRPEYDGAATKINGEFAPFTAAGYVPKDKSAVINLQGGNDAVTVKSQVAVDNLTIRTENGADFVRLEGTVTADKDGSPYRDTLINTGAGNDWVELVNVFFGKKNAINTGDGEDLISGKFTGSAEMQMGAAEDTVQLEGLNSGMNIDLATGAGHSHVHLIGSIRGTVQGGAAIDSLKMQSVEVTGDLEIFLGDGQDKAIVIGLKGKGFPKFQLYSGGDRGDYILANTIDRKTVDFSYHGFDRILVAR